MSNAKEKYFYWGSTAAWSGYAAGLLYRICGYTDVITFHQLTNHNNLILNFGFLSLTFHQYILSLLTVTNILVKSDKPLSLNTSFSESIKNKL